MECSAVRSLIDLRLSLRQTTPEGLIQAELNTAADSGTLASDVCEPFDADAFADSFLRPLGNYALQPIANSDLANGGRVLAGCLLPRAVRSAFLAQYQGLAPHSQLRLRLAIDSPALAALPFEYTFLDELSADSVGGFLALLPNLHIVREVNVARAPGLPKDPERDAMPMRVLAISADPGTARYPSLPHVEGELSSLVSALQNAPELRRSFRVEPARHATPESLRRQIIDTRPHILHFLGHADQSPTGPFLVLLGESGGSAPFFIDSLAESLASTPVRLVVLSACGAPSSVHRLAETLIRSGGADSVVAMQLPLRDAMTRPFARALYSAYAEGSAVEECVWQARQAIQGAGPDWGVAVVYGRTQSLDTNEQPDSRYEAPAGEADDASSAQAAAEGTPAIDASAPLPELERPFIGRRQAVEAVLQKVRSPDQRLVTITGIGGMGKTTLAVQCARLLRDEFPGNVFYVSLDAIEGREAIVSALCAALGLDPAAAATPELSLLQGIRGLRASKRVILVIDCFERHIAQAGLVEALLSANPALSCLVTSRIVLGLPREFQYPLDPMATAPPVDATPTKPARSRSTRPPGNTTEATSEALAAVTLTDSVALFREAARHVLPDFDVEPANRDAVEALCALLEGVPLALVLAAGRLRHLSVEDLLAQVQARPLKILRRRRIGLESSDRHSDLQEVIAGSFELLDDVEREALRQFGVFVGGFGVDAALAVCDPGPDSDVLDNVSRLREHSLIQADGRSGRTRYRLLDTVREYVSALEDDDQDAPGHAKLMQDCRRRHARHFAAVAQALRAGMRRSDNVPASSELWTELGNLRAAIAWAVESNAAEMLISFGDALARIYAEAGLWGDFDALTAAAQAAHERRDEPAKRLRLLAYRAQMARRRGAETEARVLLERIREDCAARGDLAGEADALFELASQARDLGELERTQDLLMQTGRLAKSAGLTGVVSNARAVQASVARSRGDQVQADTLAHEAVALLESTTDRDHEIFTCVNVGQLWRDAGALDQAEGILHRALQVSLDGARTFGASRALLELGPLYERLGQLDQAARAYLAADRLHADLDASRRVEAAAALRRFRRLHAATPEVAEVTRAVRAAPWNELAARLLMNRRAPQIP